MKRIINKRKKLADKLIKGTKKSKPSNKEQLEISIKLIRQYSPKAGRNQRKLSYLTGINAGTINGILQRPDCKDLKKYFNSFEREDKKMEMQKKKVAKIAKAIPRCNGELRDLASKVKMPEQTVKYYVWDYRFPHLKESMGRRRALCKSRAKKDYTAHVMDLVIEHKADKHKIAKDLDLTVTHTATILNSPGTPALKKLYDTIREQQKQKKAEARAAAKAEKLASDELKGNPDFEIDTKREGFLPHQIDFAYMEPGEVKHPAIVGGFGSGKTMSVPLRWLKLIEYRMSQGKKCDLMVLEPTNEMIRDIIVPTFDEFFAKFEIPVKYLSQRQNYTIEYKGAKHMCMLRSAERPASLTGKNLSDIIIDEFDRIPYYKQKQVWRECISRIRKTDYGTCSVVTTPEGYKLTHELWVEKKSKAFNCIKAKTSNNIHLPPDYIENLIEQYDSKLAKQYLEGEFVNIESDIVYYCFDRKVNVIADEKIPAGDDNRIIISFDFNVNPMCAVEIIMQGKARYQVYEYKISNSNTKELCETIIDSLKRRYENCDKLNIILTGDASGTARSSSGEHSDFEIIRKCFSDAEFADSFISLQPANPPVRERVNYVNSVLEKKQFFIAESCKASVKDREIVSWKKGSRKFIIDKSDRATTHLSDAADYGIWVSRYAMNKDNNEQIAVSIPFVSRYS
ncbi:MAG: terminase family protein [Ignavibacteria bacterium]|nr:terminase family protein [Ignavibacteria bacterium]